jgi:predicted  nucleic acid-binding Zn-ribbon protein
MADQVRFYMKGGLGLKDALHLTIKGIKCDNPDCEYRNEDVSMTDYEKWLNKPCPKCGSNLLTQADFDATRALIAATEVLNGVIPKAEDDEKMATVSIEMNGTGDINFEGMKGEIL